MLAIIAAMSSVGGSTAPVGPSTTTVTPTPSCANAKYAPSLSALWVACAGTADSAGQRHEPHRPLEADLVVVGLAHPLQQLFEEPSNCRYGS